MSNQITSMYYEKLYLTLDFFNIICFYVLFLTKIFSRHSWCLTVLDLRVFRQEQKLMNYRLFSIHGEFP